MATLTPTTITVSGGVVASSNTTSAASGGDEAPVGQGRLLYVEVASGASGTRTVTVTAPGNVQGLDVADASATLSAGDRWLLPLTRVFYDPSTTRAAITYDDNTDVSVAVLEPEH